MRLGEFRIAPVQRNCSAPSLIWNIDEGIRLKSFQRSRFGRTLGCRYSTKGRGLQPRRSFADKDQSVLRLIYFSQTPLIPSSLLACSRHVRSRRQIRLFHRQREYRSESTHTEERESLP